MDAESMIDGKKTLVNSDRRGNYRTKAEGVGVELCAVRRVE
jgi:hypothetical protein